MKYKNYYDLHVSKVQVDVSTLRSDGKVLACIPLNVKIDVYVCTFPTGLCLPSCILS